MGGKGGTEKEAGMSRAGVWVSRGGWSARKWGRKSKGNARSLAAIVTRERRREREKKKEREAP
mgnify:CR=1 FL=1